VYAALGLGIIVTYKATGVINFAVGALGAWSAYVYTELRSSGDLVLPVVFIPARIHLASQLPVSASYGSLHSACDLRRSVAGRRSFVRSGVVAGGGCPVSHDLAHVSLYLTAFGAVSR
jgi:branched-subunit amino acid ABC-type transport system permease component